MCCFFLRLAFYTHYKLYYFEYIKWLSFSIAAGRLRFICHIYNSLARALARAPARTHAQLTNDQQNGAHKKTKEKMCRAEQVVRLSDGYVEYMREPVCLEIATETMAK